jgi:hypothetical protein
MSCSSFGSDFSIKCELTNIKRTIFGRPYSLKSIIYYLVDGIDLTALNLSKPGFFEAQLNFKLCGLLLLD